MAYVVFPQAGPRMIPPFVGLCTILIKDTSLAAIIGVFELTRAAQETIERTFRSFEIYLTAAAIYFVICFPLTRFAQRAEARLLRPCSSGANCRSGIRECPLISGKSRSEMSTRGGEAARYCVR